MTNKPTSSDQIKAIIQLPFMAAVLVPAAIYFFANDLSIIPMEKLSSTITLLLGVLFLLDGIILFVMSLKLFIEIGNGTLAPWNPTKKMIIHGLYRYVRNPMLIGVSLILLGEAFIIQSGNILIWMICFVIMNTFYFIYKEEPDLLAKFGDEYAEYCKHVPRWIPRFTAYRPEGEL